MKLLLIGFLTVQITAVIYAYRRHGSSPRNSASFLLRKVCVEVAGMKEKVVGLEQDNAAFKEDVAGLEEKVFAMEKENAALKENVAGLEQDNEALKEDVAGLEQEITTLKQPGNPYVTNDFTIFFNLDESIFIF